MPHYLLHGRDVDPELGECHGDKGVAEVMGAVDVFYSRSFGAFE